MEDDSCVFPSCLAARVHEQAVWKHRKAISIVTTAASITGNVMTLFLCFKNSAIAAMQYILLMLLRDPPHLLIFFLVMFILLIILVMSGTFDKRVSHTDTCGRCDIAHSGLLSLFDEDIPHDQVASLSEDTDFMNESSIHGSTFHEFNVPVCAVDISGQFERAEEHFEVRLDVVDDEEELISEWKREKLIFTGSSIPDDEYDGAADEDIDEFNERIDAFIRRVRMGFCMER